MISHTVRRSFMACVLASLLSPLATQDVLSQGCIYYEDHMHMEGFAPATYAKRVATSGDYAYLLCDGGPGANLLRVYDVSSPDTLPLVGNAETLAGSSDLAYAQGYVYVSHINNGVRQYDVSNPSSPLAIDVFHTEELQIVDVAAQGNYVYAYDWWGGYLLVIDASVPGAMHEVGRVQVVPWDFGKLTVSGDFVYVMTIDTSTLRVIDVSTPSAPVQVGNLYFETQATDIAYADSCVYVSDQNGGLSIVNVTWPWFPSHAGEIDLSASCWAVSVMEQHAYVGSQEGVHVVDVSVSSAPQLVCTLTDQSVSGIATLPGYAYAACEHDIMSLDVWPEAPAPLVLGAAGTPDTAKDVAVAGNRAYVAAADSGLVVVDVSDFGSPSVLATLDTPGRAESIALWEDHVYVADRLSGLQVIDVSTPDSPSIVGFLDEPYIWDVAIQDGMAFICTSSEFMAVDISIPDSPTIIGWNAQGGTFLAVSGDLACLINTRWLNVIDISVSSSPQVVGVRELPIEGRDVAIAGDVACVAVGNAGLCMIDIFDPGSLPIVGMIDTPAPTYGVTVAGKIAYVPDSWAGVQVIDIIDVRNPRILGAIDTPGSALKCARDGDLLYVADGEGGLQIVPAQCDELTGVTGSIPSRPARLEVFPNPFNPSVTIRFTIDRPQAVQVAIYDLSGRRVGVVADRTFGSGRQAVNWDGRDTTGRAVASGGFIVQLRSEEKCESQKVTLIR